LQRTAKHNVILSDISTAANNIDPVFIKDVGKWYTLNGLNLSQSGMSVSQYTVTRDFNHNEDGPMFQEKNL